MPKQLPLSAAPLGSPLPPERRVEPCGFPTAVAGADLVVRLADCLVLDAGLCRRTEDLICIEAPGACRRLLERLDGPRIGHDGGRGAQARPEDGAGVATLSASSLGHVRK